MGRGEGGGVLTSFLGLENTTHKTSGHFLNPLPLSFLQTVEKFPKEYHYKHNFIFNGISNFLMGRGEGD